MSVSSKKPFEYASIPYTKQMKQLDYGMSTFTALRTVFEAFLTNCLSGTTPTEH